MSESSDKFRAFLRTLVPFAVDFTMGSSDKDDGTSPDRYVTTLEEADVISSRHPFSGLGDLSERHMVVLDIDHQSWLLKSSTPGHYHLYIEVPGGIGAVEYMAMVDAMAEAGVVEKGFAGASRARGFTSCRLPWKRKEQSDGQG